MNSWVPPPTRRLVNKVVKDHQLDTDAKRWYYKAETEPKDYYNAICFYLCIPDPKIDLTTFLHSIEPHLGWDDDHPANVRQQRMYGHAFRKLLAGGDYLDW